jgi:hypothetical protein
LDSLIGTAEPNSALALGDVVGRRPVRRARDVIISHYIEVHDRRRTNFVTSRSGEAYQLYDEDLFLFLALDGHTPYSEIEAEFIARFKTRLRMERFERFLYQLFEYGLLEFVDETSTDETVSAEPPRRGLDEYTDPPEERFERVPFGITFWNPRPMFLFLGWIFRPFMPYLVYGLIPLVWFAGLIAIKDQNQIFGDISTLRGMTNIYVSICVAWIVDNLLSRISQGTVATAFGADIDGLGFSLFLGVLPRFFIEDVPIKRLTRPQMLWCYAAPVLFRLFLTAIGILIWSACHYGNSPFKWFGLMCAELGAFASILSVWPVIPGDAYRLMFTYLEQPLLRRRALSLLKLYVFFRGAPEGLSNADKWGLCVIGSLTILTSGVLIVAGVAYFFNNLLTAHQGLGVALWTLGCGSSAAWALLAMRFAKILFGKTSFTAARDDAPPEPDIGALLQPMTTFDRYL